ncbi:PhoH family protein [Oceanospirillum linum]|uniref:PhoH-like protein n=1 Tax=Oceanospirillum linum TaxID=966 RepID=A0A1T1H9N7_OCELI|nr:PhoH family protein [Oceanospirillum linum]OOV86440.1 PhoH family protein [Oceanospirillum linum]SEG33417.1 phosphate starvation-inducible protein PhoH [Oleiphilus messinensis]SMP29276.1 phosphate starvation-inducible protein PhoH [Oceanospirillum linum]
MLATTGNALNSNSQTHILKLDLEPNDAQRLANLCGLHDEHLRLIESRMNIIIRNRSNQFQLAGELNLVKAAASLLESLYQDTGKKELTPESIHLHLQSSGISEMLNTRQQDQEGAADKLITLRTPKGTIQPRGPNQQKYVRTVLTNDINFGVGPAGTGKTYLAVACAVEALTNDEVRRILLVRPAVEAGEKLGFLPGDLSQKVDPYLRPLYDALYEMLGFEQVAKLIERNIIEVAPLAYMRGRTLNNAFIILDESQNTTREQMKMFLTRIGFGSTAVITGDVTQVDLPKGQKSGLIHVLDVLDGVDGVGVTRFDSKDVVRHPMVQRIVEAYDKHEAEAEIKEQQARQAREAARKEALREALSEAHSTPENTKTTDK